MSAAYTALSFSAKAQAVVFNPDGTGFTDYRLAMERSDKPGPCTDWLVLFEGQPGRIRLEPGTQGQWFLMFYASDRPGGEDRAVNARACSEVPTHEEVGEIVRVAVLSMLKEALIVEVGTANRFTEIPA